MTITLEKTSKPLKAQLFLSLFTIAFGALSWFLPYGHSADLAEISWSAAVTFAGAVWYVVTRVLIWWQHR